MFELKPKSQSTELVPQEVIDMANNLQGLTDE